MNRLLSFCTILLLFTSCKSAVDNEKYVSIIKAYKLSVEKIIETKDYWYYQNLKFLKGNQIIYRDTSKTTYSFDNKLYPYIHQSPNSIEVLIEVDDRPSKNYLRHFKLENGKVIELDRLPTLVCEPKNLDSDNTLEIAGYWDYSQIWGDNSDITAYNPLIYYEMTSKGIQLDTTLTININSEIYGQFSGYYFSESIEVSTKTTDKLGEEIKRIEGIK